VFVDKTLTLILLMWRIWGAPNNASKWQMGFNSAFKGLISIYVKHICFCYYLLYTRLHVSTYTLTYILFKGLFLYLFLQTLYMFQAVPPPIIRST